MRTYLGVDTCREHHGKVTTIKVNTVEPCFTDTHLHYCEHPR